LTGARVERRLAAILAADVVGFSALMEGDEEDTYSRIGSLRREVIEPHLSEHQGRLIKTTGDGFLAEFASPIAALRCALAIQSTQLDDPNALRLRIGLNLGDVIIEEGGDVYGEGVNVAARLEGLADPGGILISGKIHSEVEGKVGATFEDRGERQVKNITRPVRIYAVRASRTVPTSSEKSLPRDITKPLQLPDKPSIAVLPFQNMSGDPEQEYFADGMVEDIITALSRFKLLFVIARNSSFTYKGKPIDIKQVGRELGVRYVLEGSVRRAGNKVRITGQLIDASTGTHLWADHFDGILEDIFDLQDRVTGSVVAAIAPKVQQAELERSRRKPTESLDAYDYYLRGVALNVAPTKEVNDEALQFFSAAIELDPDFASPYAAAARCYSQRKAFGWMVDAAQETAEAYRLVQMAVKLGADDAFVLGLSGFATFYVFGDVEGGAVYIERARSLNPNLAILWGGAGLINVCLGQAEIGITQLAHAIRLSPLDPSMGLWQHSTALGHFFSGRDADALSWIKMAMRTQWTARNDLLFLAASNGFLGHVEEAQAAVVRLHEVDPACRISNLADIKLYRRAQDRERLVEGLRLAGLPE
jgi:TolB-like protein/class 3 adenylate cyclase/tetratricopeptide (TPR) repeat protein